MEPKIRDVLKHVRKKSYASDCVDLPEGGIDCSEGCNPFGYPDAVRTVLKTFDPDRFSPYPHSMAAYEAIQTYWKDQCKLKRENIMLTDGSIQAIYIVNNIFNIIGAKVLGIAPQFAGYASNVKLLGMEYLSVELKKENNYRIDVEELEGRITEELSLVYLDNPNNPTGQVLDNEEIEKILRKAKACSVCVIIDEAYGDFMKKEMSAVKFLKQYENLIVIRTLSKGFGLAGVRSGYILASENLIRYMNKVANPYQMAEIVRDITQLALTKENKIAIHMENFADQKCKIRALIGRNLRMATTCDTVSVCMLYHKNEKVNLQKLFYDQKVLVVPGTEFDGLNASYVRIRLPKDDEFPVLQRAIQNLESENV